MLHAGTSRIGQDWGAGDVMMLTTLVLLGVLIWLVLKIGERLFEMNERLEDMQGKIEELYDEHLATKF